MDTVNSALQEALFNLFDAVTLAICVGIVLRVFNLLFPIFDFERISEDRAIVITIIILLLLGYLIPLVLNDVLPAQPAETGLLPLAQ